MIAPTPKLPLPFRRLVSPPIRRFLGAVRLIPAALALAASAAETPSLSDLADMLRDPGIPADRKKTDWLSLPVVPNKTVEIFHGQDGVSGYNHHQNIAYFDHRFFVIWNSGFRDEDGSGQKVVYAISQDALTWSKPVELTGRLPGRRYTCVGPWIRGGELYAVAALRDGADEAGRQRQSDVNPLLAYRWNSATGAFEAPVVLALNFFSNNIPQLAPDGQWMMLGKGTGREDSVMRFARGGTTDLGRWTIGDMPSGIRMEEAEWYVLPDQGIVALYRSYTGNTPEGGRLIRLYSGDSGKTWTNRVLTNFPAAGTRHHGLKLADGTYVLIVNPDPRGIRIPLSLALSKDGLVYTRIVNVRPEATRPRYVGKAKSPGYSYPRGMELNGNLYVVYSVNKEDVQLSIVPVSELRPR